MIEVLVDRIEGGFAVLEVGGSFVDWPAHALPAGAVEGSKLTLILDVPEDLETAEARYERLRARSKVGTDIDL